MALYSKSPLMNLLGAVVLVIAAGWGWHAVQKERAARAAQTAEATAMHAPIAWVTQTLAGTGDPNALRLFAMAGGVTAGVTTDWSGTPGGSGNLHYRVTLSTPKPGAPLTAIADACDFTLAVNDYQGQALTTVPLTFARTTGIARMVISLDAEGQVPLGMTAYGALTGLGPSQLAGGVPVQWSCR